MIKKRFPDGSDLSQAAVVTHSSGNHAQAVALAGRLCHIPAHIVMPEGSPAVKVAAVKEYGGHITFCENSEVVRDIQNMLKICGGVCLHSTPVQDQNS